MKLPESLNRLKKLGVLEDEVIVDGIKFVLRTLTNKENVEVTATVSVFTDPDTKWEMTKQKFLEFSIKTVDGQAVDNQELLKFLAECNPNVIDVLFSKYLMVAGKSNKLVQDKVENNFELADTNLTNPATGVGLSNQEAQSSPQNDAQ